jgi:uncharacterized protein YcbK (DUF882 family)
VRLLVFAAIALGIAPARADESPPGSPSRPDAAAPDDAEARSKKAAFLADKASRRDVHAARAASTAPQHPITLRNVWTDEALPLDPARAPSAPVIDHLLRCHYTNQSTVMDPRLASLLLQAAAKFRAPLIEIVSGYRAPKYQLMLRKKGREVARDSQHPLGHAVDFRLRGVRTRALYRYVRSLGVGGVGLYPESEFVHADVGRVRTWRGH